ncbi:integrase [Serratia sp. AKBS12]|uniref:integrase n=1 Tax=Serratia sp. AKBS12 TaxID=2974597 RepID=UPI00216513E7|nr:integrase [Serratia sp. AKBS12]
MFSLTQLDVPGHRRQWMLMDMVTCLPLLYPLRYCVDHLGFRSLSTQSASLQAIKFFYEFWLQKHSVTFCHSFNVSMHNPQIAIEEMTAFFHYLESGRSTPPGVIALPLSVTASRTTNAYKSVAVTDAFEAAYV